MNALFAALAIAQTPAAITAVVPASPAPIGESFLAAAGIQMARVEMGNESIVVYLPGDMMGGDTISGSAYASSGLIGSTLTVMGMPVKLNNVHGFTVKIPSDAENFTMEVSNGGTSARAEVSLNDGVRAPGWFVSPIANENGVITMLGAFDGSRHTTTAMVNGNNAAVLTESPRRMTLSAVGLGLGRHALRVADGMNEYTGNFNVVRASLHKDRIRSGKSDLKLVVDGLAGLPAEDYPLSVGLLNESPDVLRFEPDATTYAVSPVIFDAVRDGIWNGKVLVRTRKRSSFSMLAFVASDALLARMR